MPSFKRRVGEVMVYKNSNPLSPLWKGDLANSIMQKYLTIIKITWQRALTYRFSVFSYRMGEMIENLVLILMWSVVYADGQQSIKGYDFNEMITYVLMGNLINVIVRNWLYNVVSNDIKNGTLSQFLVKPIEYFRYIIIREIGRISFAFVISVATNLTLILLFYKIFYFNDDILDLLVIFLIIVFAFIFELLLSYLIGLIAFWIDEVDGVFLTIDRIKKFFSGGYFPITLLPVVFVKISFLLPFAYSYFIPTQIYLKKMDLMTGVKGIGVQLIWIMLLYLIINIVWRRGMKKYEGVGI